MIKLELLAPALNTGTAKAAILAGADAVYIGGPQFSARAEAHNTLEDLKELCDFAHQFRVRVHVAVNTLLYDKELSQADALIAALGEVGADAVIVQDPALFYAAFPPDLEVHASTQCLINTQEKLRFYAALGVRQVVLPRELTLPEIKALHECCPEVTLEAFISGALCVSESGNCFISEQLLGRSGNRGRCAQLCRLPMELRQQGRLLASGHLLSMKDNLASPLLPELVESGVRSFKIEGRLKPVEYVINQVSYLSDCLNELIAHSDGRYERSSGGEVKRSFKPCPEKTFNRGFTHELLLGSNEALVNPATPKFQGEPVGRVVRVSFDKGNSLLEVKTRRGVSLHKQDGFTYFQDGTLKGFASNSVQGSTLTVHGRLRLSQDTQLYRNHDAEFIKELLGKEALSRKVRCSLHFSIEQDKLSLKVCDEFGREGVADESFSYLPSEESISAERLKATLQKSFSPYFLVENLTVSGEPERLTVRVSQLNSLRKRAYQNLLLRLQDRARCAPFALPEPLPHYPERYVDSRLVLNERTAHFYQSLGVDLKAHKPGPDVLMTCRHCLIKAHALCHKEGGSTQGFTLTIGRHEFRLSCDCRRCRMLVLGN
ncbi:MAG: U32 family peptidase [Succinivibrio sp.]|nr:U32 family peptidase [Succinivibrio sp.]